MLGRYISHPNCNECHSKLKGAENSWSLSVLSATALIGKEMSVNLLVLIDCAESASTSKLSVLPLTHVLDIHTNLAASPGAITKVSHTARNLPLAVLSETYDTDLSDGPIPDTPSQLCLRGDMVLLLNTIPCDHGDDHRHDNITFISGRTELGGSVTVGSVRAYLFNVAEMKRVGGPGQMWHECQEFDAAHDGTKLDKIENYLANESFPVDRQAQIDEADAVLFIDEVWLEKRYRGQDRGLWAVSQLIEQLSETRSIIVLLQAGPVSWDNSSKSGDEAHDKITKHWKRLGFSEWSDSDDAWLCLASEKVKWTNRA